MPCLKARQSEEKASSREKIFFSTAWGSLEVAANEFRITLTEERLRKEQGKGQAPAENVHEAVGRKVRKTVHDEIGEFPEELPRAESIKQVEKRTRKQLKNK